MKDSSTQISTLVAQFPITLNIKQNLKNILSILSYAESDDLVILPEGALSGYAEDPTFLDHIDTNLLVECFDILRDEAAQRRLHLIFGSCVKEKGSWYNAGLYYGSCRELFVYYKVNLATSERGHFSAGSQLPILKVSFRERTVKLGIQLCREIRFPEQWQYLARAGAEVFAYLTNAIGDKNSVPVWRSHLISRAAENQRYVLCANNAQPAQRCPSMIIAPSGKVLWEVASPKLEQTRYTLDLTKVSNWYLSQSRNDIISINTC
ncbi:MAG: carbon-nitrogen hydrolase family protein [Candidatus Hodarchaeota archaeon]